MDFVEYEAVRRGHKRRVLLWSIGLPVVALVLLAGIIFGGLVCSSILRRPSHALSAPASVTRTEEDRFRGVTFSEWLQRSNDRDAETSEEAELALSSFDAPRYRARVCAVLRHGGQTHVESAIYLWMYGTEKGDRDLGYEGIRHAIAMAEFAKGEDVFSLCLKLRRIKPAPKGLLVKLRELRNSLGKRTPYEYPISGYELLQVEEVIESWESSSEK